MAVLASFRWFCSIYGIQNYFLYHLCSLVVNDKRTHKTKCHQMNECDSQLREQCKDCDPDSLLKLFAVVQQGFEVCKAEGSVEAVSIWPCLTNVGVFFVQILQKQTKGMIQCSKRPS